MLASLLVGSACDNEQFSDIAESLPKHAPVAQIPQPEASPLWEIKLKQHIVLSDDWVATGIKVKQGPPPEGGPNPHSDGSEGFGPDSGLDGYSAVFVDLDGNAYGRAGEAPEYPYFEPHEWASVPDDFLGEEVEWQQALAHAQDIVAAMKSHGMGPDIFSAGEPEKQTVLIGTDERVVFNNGGTLQLYPYRTVGSILYGNDVQTTGSCTGTMVGPRHVLTAAHCLHDGAGTWFSPIWFSPGQTKTSFPNGNPRPMVARWARTFSLSMDYGLIALADAQDTANLDWKGLVWWADLDEYDNLYVYRQDYPSYYTTSCADTPDLNNRCAGYMYFDSCYMPETYQEDGYLYYPCDTSPGSSGSASYTYIGTAPAVVNVHKRGNEPTSSASFTSNPATYNLGPRVRPTMYNDICDWIGDSPSSYAYHPCE